MRSKLPTVTVSIGALIAVACGSSSSTTPRETSEISYEAGGVGEALITYGNSSTGIRQETAILPWSTYQNAKPTDGITLRVHSNAVGPIQCKIIVNGKTRVNNQAQGTGATISCTTHG